MIIHVFTNKIKAWKGKCNIKFTASLPLSSAIRSYQTIIKESLHKGSPDQGVHFLGLDVIHFLHCILDLLLVSTQVNNENQSVVVFNLLHCRLSCERVFQNLIVIKLIPCWSTNTRIFGVPILFQSLWAMESDRCSDLFGLLLKGRA